MLLVDFEEQEGITVPYPPLFDEIRSNHGFVDLRGCPELAKQIAEAVQSQALRETLCQLAERGSPFFTVACELGAHEELDSPVECRYVAGGYLQILDANYSERLPNDYLVLAQAIARELEPYSKVQNWTIRFVHTPVMYNLDHFGSITSSLSIWFYAAAPLADTARESREIFISCIKDALFRINPVIS